MPSSHFDMISHWRIPAPVDRVWAALTDPETWPRWWPCVRAVRTLRTGDRTGVGSVRRIRWSTPLPYEIVIEGEAVEVLRHERLRTRSHGPLRGEGIWLLRAAGELTDVTSVWRVEVARSWMRWLAPLLARVLRWNHEGAMRSGEAGLTRHLAGPVAVPGAQG